MPQSRANTRLPLHFWDIPPSRPRSFTIRARERTRPASFVRGIGVRRRGSSTVPSPGRVASPHRPTATSPYRFTASPLHRNIALPPTPHALEASTGPSALRPFNARDCACASSACQGRRRARLVLLIGSIAAIAIAAVAVGPPGAGGYGGDAAEPGEGRPGDGRGAGTCEPGRWGAIGGTGRAGRESGLGNCRSSPRATRWRGRTMRRGCQDGGNRAHRTLGGRHRLAPGSCRFWQATASKDVRRRERDFPGGGGGSGGVVGGSMMSRAVRAGQPVVSRETGSPARPATSGNGAESYPHQLSTGRPCFT
jgi:hypothetical protein